MTINTSALKTYAPRARRDFISAMISSAAKFGITKNEIVDQREQGDIVIVGSNAISKIVGEQRKKLINRINMNGFDHTMEAVAYTWFNRLIAIRYLELHGLLDHGYRVLSHPSGKDFPEILEHAEHLAFPGLDKDKVIDLKLDGTKDAELYRMLLVSQCNALHRAMPYLFERIDDETELLLPDNLLHSDSLIRKLVAAIDEADWQEIEIIGWLYQFYISEKKQQVFDRPKSEKITAENIPAATQLFTPHWIVRYLVENSLGRLWLLNNPSSGLTAKMDYYIAPEEPEVDFLKINKPEEIRICDPAAGSGHMLTYAFDLLYSIYEEEGYDPKEIPALILKHNLTGIEIDERAGALAAFALAMKAAAKLGRRRFLRMDAKPEIRVLQNVSFTPAEVQDVAAMVGNDLFTDELRETLGQFEQAKNFGSLIVPKLRDAAETLRVVKARDFASDLLLKEVQTRVLTLLSMAEALSPNYHVVVANPPYLGGGGMNNDLKDWCKTQYPRSKSDTYAMFIERGLQFTLPTGYSAFITIQNWMYQSAYENMRLTLLENSRICGLLQIGYNSFPELNSKVALGAAFVLRKGQDGQRGEFFNLNDAAQAANKGEVFLLKRRNCELYSVSSEHFKSVPGSPIAYQASDASLGAFERYKRLNEVAKLATGIIAGDNEEFVRGWHEIDLNSTSKVDPNENYASPKWFPLLKGGDKRKWFGNLLEVIDFENNGARLRSTKKAMLRNEARYFEAGVHWNRLSGGAFFSRKTEAGSIFEDMSPSLFSDGNDEKILAFLNSKLGQHFLLFLSAGWKIEIGQVGGLPIDLSCLDLTVENRARDAVEIGRSDWDAYETSWDFSILPLLSHDHRGENLEDSYANLRAHWRSMVDEMKALEEGNNRTIIDAYGLQDELYPEVPIEDITLTCNPAYRYGVKGTEVERESRLKSDTMKELASYAIGCMMGRFSLTEPGLIYALSGNEGFDASRYGNFPADDDGILPVTGIEWFDDDAALRLEEFLRIAWPPGSVHENLRFIAESLTNNGGNDSERAIRNYLSKNFFKDHMKTYKKRPIYWLFSSGTLKAFECLVYLHRYNEGTLSRMRMEYVTPLLSRMAARIDGLDDDIAVATSSAARTRAQKEKDLLVKQLEELKAFDEELRHFADQRITLDLDEGVKVNYGKFGNLLAERKAVTGEK